MVEEKIEELVPYRGDIVGCGSHSNNSKGNEDYYLVLQEENSKQFIQIEYSNYPSSLWNVLYTERQRLESKKKSSKVEIYLTEKICNEKASYTGKGMIKLLGLTS
ncbi:MAG: hypothetical protein WC781_01330 [Candidatus Pacearchaeota archaeon]|jgi:hypothetical protein